MRGPKACVIDGMKFMWDGENYASLEDARKKQAEYEKDGFETRIVDEEGNTHVYTRRVVREVTTDGPPPT